MIILATILLLSGSLVWTAFFRPPNKPAYLLTLYVLSVANVVLTGYIANTFRLLSNQWMVVGIHASIAGLGWAVWQHNGKPSLWGPFVNWEKEFTPKKWIGRLPALTILALGLGLLYSFGIVLLTTVPQNNLDSLSTHLSRIGFWLQHGSFYPWPTPRLFQVIYPVNAQLQTYWTVLFLHNDLLVGIVQWLAAVASGIGVFGLARLLGSGRRASAYAALIYMGFPLVILQSTTTQNDLVTTALFVPAVYFVILGIKSNHNHMLTLSAISAGLGLGTKQTYFFLLPGLGILAILIVVDSKKRRYSQIVHWGISLILSFALFGSYMYVVNWQSYGNPFGPPEAVDELSYGDINFRTISGKLGFNIPRLFYQSLDTVGLPRPLDGYAQKVKQKIAVNVSQLLRINIEGEQYTASGHKFSFADKNIGEESYAWFGPLSILLLLPATILETWLGLKKRQYLKLGIVLCGLIFLVIEIIFRPGWDPYQGRYFAPIIAINAPFIAIWFGKHKSTVGAWIAVIMTLTIAFTAALYNPAKPVFGKYADEIGIWKNDRIFLQTLQRKKERAMQYMVANNVPLNTTLAYYAPYYILDYPLFGKNFTRKVIPVYPLDEISNNAWMQGNGIQYLLIANNQQNPAISNDYELIKELPDWSLYRLKSIP